MAFFRTGGGSGFPYKVAYAHRTFNVNSEFSYDFSEDIGNGELVGVMTITNGTTGHSNGAIAVYSNDDSFYSAIKPFLNGLSIDTNNNSYIWYSWDSWTSPSWSISGNTYSADRILGYVADSPSFICIFILFYK